METGEYRTERGIKPDATPIDNVEKFAWYEDDYFTITQWVEFTPEELEEQAEREAEKAKAEAQAAFLESAPERMDGAEAAQADADDAICALYEESMAMQATIEEQDDAICALYEMAMGGVE